jgi:mRNA interferase MazF
MRRSVTFERFAVHFVEFTFSDKPRQKGRPALVLTAPEFARATGNVTVAMITSAKHSSWPGDCVIDDLGAAGLTRGSMVRLRLATIAVQRIGRSQGRLAQVDRARVTDAFHELLGL